MAGSHLRTLERLFFGASTKSRKPSGVNVFSGHISGRRRGFLLSIDPKLKVVRSCTFSGYRSRPLGEPHDRYEEAAKGCLELYFFESSQRPAGEIFRKGLTQSRRLSGFNVFSGYISERWRDFLLSIDPKPKALWPERFSGVYLQRLERLFAQYRSKAEGGLELHFFGASQQAT